MGYKARTSVDWGRADTCVRAQKCCQRLYQSGKFITNYNQKRGKQSERKEERGIDLRLSAECCQRLYQSGKFITNYNQKRGKQSKRKGERGIDLRSLVKKVGYERTAIVTNVPDGYDAYSIQSVNAVWLY